MKERVVLLASGGMDSVVLAYKLIEEGKEVKVLFFEYSQHFSKKEYNQLISLLPTTCNEDVEVIDIRKVYENSSSSMIQKSDLWNDDIRAEDLYLPYRNLLFLTVASAYAQSNDIYKVYAGFIDSNHVKEIDCSMNFFNNLNSLLGDLGSVEIILPFRNMTKYEVAKLGINLGVDIEKTYSCQVNPEYHCGSCPNCVDRLNALELLYKE